MQHTLTDSELSFLASQFAMVLQAGISIQEGISILLEDAPSEDGKKILRQINQSLEDTGELALSLRKSNAFPEYFLKMTDIGERSGTLEEIMDSLADYYQRQHVMMKSIRDTLTYPMVLLGMLFAILIVLMTQVMPVFRDVFAQLGIEMTGVSSAVFRIGTILQGSSAVILVVVIALVVACYFGMRSKKGRTVILQFASHIPLVRRVNHLLASSRFSDALSLALHSGLDIQEGFMLAAELTGQKQFHEKLKRAEEQIEQGEELYDALRSAEIYTGLNARIVSLGFRTGSAEDALKRIAITAQEDAETQIQNAIGALEPILTAILSILTGLILISVMLPLLGVMTNIG